MLEVYCRFLVSINFASLYIVEFQKAHESSEK